MKILLVDDDLFLCDMYATKFSEKGHEVEQAHNAESALAYLDSNEVDVVLLDMIMPGMTGVQLLTKMKEAQAVAQKTPPTFIILSNQSEESDKQAAAEAGAVGYIVKAELMPSGVVEEVEKLVKK
ncbi:response regulator [Candidatus Parcubacteria bacterium]|uniref:Response regulatory domain-containing protein n=1 Tax=Candidatus Kaiserbacteria bacterium CG10_big_fil_rev_8_21_14_0_10_47_16 TaxID=1974608 RepID=A0A2H0UDJ8_9BACT|nr:response regulator [Candidatus Parcubacteria bacterium]PIR84472.1 MAG: hypothetical protein COU16_02740 [Candidatus Kaiserbacteria bacterium CG10_big_fil_rev_8_21_14_0_10_47_16]